MNWPWEFIEYYFWFFSYYYVAVQFHVMGDSRMHNMVKEHRVIIEPPLWPNYVPLIRLKVKGLSQEKHRLKNWCGSIRLRVYHTSEAPKGNIQAMEGKTEISQQSYFVHHNFNSNCGSESSRFQNHSNYFKSLILKMMLNSSLVKVMLRNCTNLSLSKEGTLRLCRWHRWSHLQGGVLQEESRSIYFENILYFWWFNFVWRKNNIGIFFFAHVVEPVGIIYRSVKQLTKLERYVCERTYERKPTSCQ